MLEINTVTWSCVQFPHNIIVNWTGMLVQNYFLLCYEIWNWHIKIVGYVPSSNKSVWWTLLNLLTKNGFRLIDRVLLELYLWGVIVVCMERDARHANQCNKDLTELLTNKRSDKSLTILEIIQMNFTKWYGNYSFGILALFF